MITPSFLRPATNVPNGYTANASSRCARTVVWCGENTGTVVIALPGTIGAGANFTGAARQIASTIFRVGNTHPSSSAIACAAPGVSGASQ